MLVDWAPSEVEAPRRLCLSADEARFVQAAFERILPEAPHVSASTYVDHKLAESRTRIVRSSIGFASSCSCSSTIWPRPTSMRQTKDPADSASAWPERTMSRVVFLLALLSCGWLSACSVPAASAGVHPKPGCDRNGEREERVAC